MKFLDHTQEFYVFGPDQTRTSKPFSGGDARSQRPLTQYERDLYNSRVLKHMNKMDTVSDLRRIRIKLAAHHLLPVDKPQIKKMKDGTTKTIPRDSHETINRLVASQIQMIDSLIQVRLGKKELRRVAG